MGLSEVRVAFVADRFREGISGGQGVCACMYDVCMYVCECILYVCMSVCIYTYVKRCIISVYVCM